MATTSGRPGGAVLPACHDIFDTALGPLTITMAGDAVTGVLFELPRHPVDPALLGSHAPGHVAHVARQIDEYLDGARRTFDVELAPVGTPFQLRVWDELRRIPYGTTTSYGRIAAALGRPTASRAVGAANGRNPISIIVPCHRVVGASGDLTGYGGGLERKRFLLDLERSADRLF